jgi:hypothetical protein
MKRVSSQNDTRANGFGAQPTRNTVLVWLLQSHGWTCHGSECVCVCVLVCECAMRVRVSVSVSVSVSVCLFVCGVMAAWKDAHQTHASSSVDSHTHARTHTPTHPPHAPSTSPSLGHSEFLGDSPPTHSSNTHQKGHTPTQQVMNTTPTVNSTSTTASCERRTVLW